MAAVFLILLLITCLRPSWSLISGNLSMPEVPLEFSSLEESSESELSSQLQEMDERSSGWSPWSEWSACSRSCDGGASHQLRSCKSGPCRGEHVRYKICNMQVNISNFFYLGFIFLYKIIKLSNAFNSILDNEKNMAR